MTGLLTRTAIGMRMMLPVRPAPAPVVLQTRGCEPDCRNEYLCDSNHLYYSRLCCYTSGCKYVCDSWVNIGTC